MNLNVSCRRASIKSINRHVFVMLASKDVKNDLNGSKYTSKSTGIFAESPMHAGMHAS